MTVLRTIATIGLIGLFILLWIFVFKATDCFNDTVGSDWLCGGTMALILSAVTFPFVLLSIHKKD